MTTLTSDQRWLLAAYDPSMLADLIVTPEYGLSRIKSTCAGGTARHADGPEWLRSYDTGGGKISGGMGFGDYRVTITFAALSKWAAAVPDRLRVKLANNLTERGAEMRRTHDWCHCPYKDEAPNAHSKPCTRYHPTDAEDDALLLADRRRYAGLRALVWDAIWDNDEPEQLDLFEVGGRSA